MFSAAIELILNVAYREATVRRHTHLTLEHLLYVLAHDPEGEKILTACGSDLPALRHALDTFLDNLEQSRKGRQREPQQTLAFQRVLQTAVLHVQSAGKDEVRFGDVLAAILQQPNSYAAELLQSQDITRLDVLNYISHGITKTPAASGEPRPEEPAPAGQTGDGPSPARDPLAAFAVNLTERARQGRLDPLIGRRDELRRTLQILCRRRKNNPVFVGDAGVGKTALAEGLAGRLLEDDIPARLQGAEIFALDTAALLAGTRFRGDFEERFKAVVDALAGRRLPILFIDEVHATVGAGATTGGTMDLAMLIKPLLAAGDLRLIGSTTFDEFKQIERDRGLARRLQRVVLEEPSVDETVEILTGLRPRYEEHHRVTFTDRALRAAAKLARRHLRDSRLPDSAIDVLDEAGASFTVTGTDAPAGARAAEAPPTAGEAAPAAGSVTAPAEAKAAPDTRAVTAPATADAAAETPAPLPRVTAADIERVLARMARIPEKQATGSDKERLRTLDEALRRVVFGQDDAVAAVVTAIKRARAGLGQPERPAGCFLFTGPTGVGKTELAKQLAIHLGNEFLRYDMSEYMEKHAVARLIGAPPGYIGFEQGGLLVDAVRAHPYAVLLLDEIEKAHPDVYNILLQVMDHATLTDNNGRKADFRQVVVIMTSNAGSREASAAPIGFSEDRTNTGKGRTKAAIERAFSPEFRNRLDAIVTFDSLAPSVVETIVEKFVLQLETQLAERRVAITLRPDARVWLAEKGYDPTYGARPLARLIQTEVRNPLTDEILFGRLEHGGTVRIGLAGDKLQFDVEPTPPASDADEDGE
jgi:ATP-dependent Clp protease ATP-binding subunit ClpA